VATKKRRRRGDRNWGFWVEYQRPGYIGLKVEKIAPASLLDRPGYERELKKLVRAVRKRRGRIKITDVMFGGRPSWGRKKLLKRTPKNVAALEERMAKRRRRTSKTKRHTSKRHASRRMSRRRFSKRPRRMSRRRFSKRRSSKRRSSKR
jgi:hypothetical protein